MATRGYTHPGTRRVSHYDPTLSSGYSANLWKTCPLLEYQHDPMIGVLLDERWQSYNAAATTGDYVLTQATTGTGAISTAAPGVLELDSNSTTATQGANLQRVKSVFVPAAGKHIWAEFKVKVVDTYDKAEVFVGLSDVETAILAASANASDNHIGWQCVTDDGVLLFSGEKAGTGATRAAATIAEDTYITLGFYVNGVTEVEQYVNGVLTGTNTATANIPVVALVPSFVCQSGGTNDPILHVQGYRIFQLR
jgi:hypothetical protein